MKRLFVLIMIFVGLQVEAKIPGYKKVPDEKMSDYKLAIRKALAENAKAVSGCDANWVQTNTDYVKEIYVSTSSTQPLLIFNTYYSGQKDEMHRLVFWTSGDLKSVIQVDAEIYRFTEVNNGDLANPVIVHDYVLDGRWSCAARD